MTKPAVSRGRVNAAVVHRQRMLLFGEICPAWRWRAEGENTSGATLVDQGPGAASGCRLRRAKPAAEPMPTQRLVQQCASAIGQKSAEAVVACESEGPNMNDKEERCETLGRR